MSSFRKRYLNRVESSPRGDVPPVTTAPTEAAKLPEPVADAKPPGLPESESPAEKAGQAEIAKRLAEMENAERLAREQPPQHVAEPQAEPQELNAEELIAGANIPDLAKTWLRQHPEYVLDPEKNAEIIALHKIAKRQAGSEFTDDYFERMEDLLGLAPLGNGQAQRPTPARIAAPPRPSAPPRQVSAVSYSAPPTREPPSMTTGRAPSSPMRLTAEELELARSLKITPEEYAANKRLMLKMKADGTIVDGR